MITQLNHFVYLYLCSIAGRQPALSKMSWLKLSSPVPYLSSPSWGECDERGREAEKFLLELQVLGPPQILRYLNRPRLQMRGALHLKAVGTRDLSMLGPTKAR